MSLDYLVDYEVGIGQGVMHHDQLTVTLRSLLSHVHSRIDKPGMNSHGQVVLNKHKFSALLGHWVGMKTKKGCDWQEGLLSIY